MRADLLALFDLTELEKYYTGRRARRRIPGRGGMSLYDGSSACGAGTTTAASCRTST